LKALLESQKHGASEESAPEDDVIISQFSRSKFIRSQFLQRLKSVDKV